MNMWLIFIISALFAQECPSVDMRADFGPARNQSDSRFCFAFAVADLIGHTLGLKPPEMVSAFDLASLFASSSSEERQKASNRISILGDLPEESVKDFAIRNEIRAENLYTIKGGSPSWTASLAVSRGFVCKESEIPSQALKESLHVGPWETEQIDTFLFRQIADATGMFPPQKKKIRLSQWNDSNSVPLICPRQKNVNSVAGFKDLRNKTWLEANRQLRFNLNQRCRSPLKFENFRFVTEYYNLNSIAATELRKGRIQSLLSKRKPFVLGFNHSFLLKDQERLPGSLIPNHGAVVTGQRWNKEKHRCELQIRDSSGRQCDGPVLCEDGYYYVDIEKLARQPLLMEYAEGADPSIWPDPEPKSMLKQIDPPKGFNLNDLANDRAD